MQRTHMQPSDQHHSPINARHAHYSTVLHALAFFGTGKTSRSARKNIIILITNYKAVHQERAQHHNSMRINIALMVRHWHDILHEHVHTYISTWCSVRARAVMNSVFFGAVDLTLGVCYVSLHCFNMRKWTDVSAIYCLMCNYGVTERLRCWWDNAQNCHANTHAHKHLRVAV